MSGWSCNQENLKSLKEEKVQHSIWNKLLQEYVDTLGYVDYIGFKQSENELDQYLEALSSTNPYSDKWTEMERLAFWINAYNAFTIKLILDHLPLESIKDIKQGIPFVNSVWDIRFFNISGKKFDLNRIEHRILRKKFAEPRIHFAINCASISCPKLLNEAYVPEKLEGQLNEAAVDFLSDSSKNVISPDHILISKIFRWFKGDFIQEMNLISFINQFSNIEVNQTAKIEYLDYNWSLNSQ